MRIKAINILSSTAIGASWVFVPLFAYELGANDWQVGLIVGAWGTARFISSFIFGRLADIYGRRFILWLGLITATITFFLQGFASSSFMLALLRGAAGFTTGIFPAAIYAYVHDTGHRVGRYTAYESLGWGVGSLIAGVTSIYWAAFVLSMYFSVYWSIFTLSSLILFIALIISLKIPEIKTKPQMVPRFPVNVIKKNGNIYLAYLLRHTAAMSVWTIFPLFLRELGASLFWIAMMMVVNACSQFFIMHFLDRFKSVYLIGFGLMVATITFFSFGIAANYYQILLLHFCIALSWSSMYVGSLNHLLENNEEKATAAGLLNSALSLAGIIGPLLGGFTAEIFGYKTVIFNAAALAFISLILFFMLTKDFRPTRRK
ncbi:MAG: MFS transporter [Thermoplasmata archaeon]|nr:MAG: MFS transporter [Thermoplasmata archaeon]